MSLFTSKGGFLGFDFFDRTDISCRSYEFTSLLRFYSLSILRFLILSWSCFTTYTYLPPSLPPIHLTFHLPNHAKMNINVPLPLPLRSLPLTTSQPPLPTTPKRPLIRRLPDTLRNHFVAMSGEFVGTVLFLFFALSGAQVANTIPSTGGVTVKQAGANPQQLQYIALCFGFSLAVNAWVFFRISGGLFNPAVRILLLHFFAPYRSYGSIGLSWANDCRSRLGCV